MIAPLAVTGQKAYVTAFFDNSRTDILKEFRCNTCGKIMFKYWDSLNMVVPGRVEDIHGTPKIYECQGDAKFTNIAGYGFNAKCRTVYWIY